MKYIILLSLVSLSAFSYDISCKASRYLGFVSYSFDLTDINTAFKKRSGTLKIKKSSSGDSIFNNTVSVVADYLDSNLLTVETRDLSVSGYIDTSSGDGDIEVNGKKYSLSSCSRK